MMAPDIAREARQAITLIKSFSLELDTYSPESQVLYWLNTYRAAWIRDAIIEAVYQGRYKIISVKHILSIWQRRGQPVRHFTSGFEQVIAKQLGSPLHMSASLVSQPIGPTFSPMNKPDGDDFAPSPMSSSVVVSPTAASSVLSYDHYLSLSIEAFPVESVDTLVEVYQASPPETRDAERLGATSAPPIQPFRPMSGQQTYA
ncbi:hypothetical protein IQ260_00795 [Leptolyngbya cf. ectocarpi LEGE 11479]|uniref:Uncharacterized protein n=1 Tax=Leptolyngbya cf. ectocarpi LEGE 11479 TaxID=1828722 RepID=A0A928ZQB0_LEPEC|nr:hypothetical protein [Leptolyngbya ectocarpi]MBE9065188.1 hypothetical protein [Leptolyngbya cf. ectocarpi LEGE 11479]